MHKPFYASGFLFHVATEQILLQQFNNGHTTNLTLFGGKSKKGDDPQTVFQRCVEEAIGSPIPTSSIRPVYDYVHDSLGDHFIFYVEMSGTIPKAYASKNNTTWFSLAKLAKQTMSEQTRHDIIVSIRVIQSHIDAKHSHDNHKGYANTSQAV